MILFSQQHVRRMGQGYQPTTNSASADAVVAMHSYRNSVVVFPENQSEKFHLCWKSDKFVNPHAQNKEGTGQKGHHWAASAGQEMVQHPQGLHLLQHIPAVDQTQFSKVGGIFLIGQTVTGSGNHNPDIVNIKD